MKNYLFSLLAVVWFLSACRKHDSAESLRLKTEGAIRGQWIVDSVAKEYYEPIPVFKNKTVYIGQPGDSVIFTQSEAVYNHCAEIPIPMSSTFGMVNYRQLGWGNDFWYVSHISSKRLIIEKDANYVDRNQRVVQRFYFHR